MSKKKQIARNNDAELRKYGNQLKPGWQRYSTEEKNLFVNMSRNGITPLDMVREIEKTRREVFERASVKIQKLCYAAIAIVLKENYGFSDEECQRAMVNVDGKVMLAVDLDDIAKEMEEKCHLRFSPNNGVERIESV